MVLTFHPYFFYYQHIFAVLVEAIQRSEKRAQAAKEALSEKYKNMRSGSLSKKSGGVYSKQITPQGDNRRRAATLLTTVGKSSPHGSKRDESIFDQEAESESNTPRLDEKTDLKTSKDSKTPKLEEKTPKTKDVKTPKLEKDVKPSKVEEKKEEKRSSADKQANETEVEGEAGLKGDAKPGKWFSSLKQKMKRKKEEKEEAKEAAKDALKNGSLNAKKEDIFKNKTAVF